MVVIAALLSGCQTSLRQQPTGMGAETTAPAPAEGAQTGSGTWELTLTAKQVTPVGLVLEYTFDGSSAAGALETGNAFTVARWDGTDYVPVETLDGESPCWTEEALGLPPKGQLEVDWEHLYGALEPGDYRVEKEFFLYQGPGDYDAHVFYIDFTIG